MRPVFNRGELVVRQTLDQEMFSDHQRLLGYSAIESLKAWHKAEHPEDFRVSATLPALDSEGNLKLLQATNYRFTDEETRSDIKVCAERALLDNAVEPGDVSLGVLFVRGTDPKGRDMQGLRPMNALHPCGNCRKDLARFIGPQLLVASFVGDAAEPAEAASLKKLIEYHDKAGEYPTMPLSARNFVLARLAMGDTLTIKKPSSVKRVKRS